MGCIAPYIPLVAQMEVEKDRKRKPGSDVIGLPPVKKNKQDESGGKATPTTTPTTLMCSLSLSLSLCVGTLFVGNLSFDVDEDLLQEFVTSQGHTPSSVRVITSYDGRSKGYAVCFIHTPFCLNILYSILGTRLGPILYCVLCTIIFANCNTCACECAYTCTCSISSSQQRPPEFIMW